MMEEPLSPTSALICHSLHNHSQPPPVAIVHEANLNRRPSSKASTGMEMGLGCYAHSTRMVGDMVLRPLSSSATAGRRHSNPVIPVGLDGYSQDLQASEGLVEGGSLRVLSEEEVIQRASNALSYFRATRQINRQARSVEEMESALERARQRRKSEELRPTKKLLELEEEYVMSDNEENEVEPTPKMTLAERMGYGVKGKQISKWKKTPQQPKKKGGFASISAGSNDLLSRLRQKRATIE